MKEIRAWHWWTFHTAMATAVAGGTWAFSGPGFDALAAMVAGVAMLLLGAIWLAWLVTYRLRAGRWSWGFVVAPLIVLAMLVALVAGVPRQVRWELSRPAFDRLVATLPAPSSESESVWQPIAVPETIGSYRIVGAYRVEGGYVFYDRHGAFFDDAGFAYLPDGPSESLTAGDGSFEAPRFWPLGGGWYNWTASW
jgi:hypothetical protein